MVICVMLSFIGCFVILLLSVFKFNSFLAFFALHYSRLLHKWQPITSIYPSCCTVCCPPVMSHYKPSSNKTRHANHHNASVPLLLTHKYKPFSTQPRMTPTRFYLEKKPLLVYFQNSKAINLPPIACYKIEKQ